jgi:hypothetical protein
LALRLDVKSENSLSAKAGKLKLMFKSLLILLEENVKQKDVLFVVDDIKLLHNECLSVLGNEGHQVFTFNKGIIH